MINKPKLDTIEEKWKNLKLWVQKTMIRRKIKTVIEQKDWLNRDCTKQKRKVGRILKKWRKGKLGIERLWEEKRKLRDTLGKAQKAKRNEGPLKGLKEGNIPRDWKKSIIVSMGHKFNRL